MGRKSPNSREEELRQLLMGRDAIWRLIAGEYPFSYHEQRSQELRALYARFDYDYHPNHARLSKQRIYRIKSHLQIEVPDFAAFQIAVDEVQKQIEARARDQEEEQIEELFLYADRHLFDTLVKARDDQRKVHELLDQAWRSGEILPPAIEAVVIRKIPIDWWDFDGFLYSVRWNLGELRKLVKDRLILWSEADCQQVLEDIDDVERGATTASLQKLIADVEGVCEAVDRESRRRKEKLDGLLWHLMLVRHQAALRILPEWGLHARYEPGLDYSDFQTSVAKEAKGYLDATWMHTPWLTNSIIATLLDAKLAPLSKLGSLIDVATLERVFPWFFWEKLLPILLPLLIMAGLTTGILLLFKYDKSWMAWGGCSYWDGILCGGCANGTTSPRVAPQSSPPMPP